MKYICNLLISLIILSSQFSGYDCQVWLQKSLLTVHKQQTEHQNSCSRLTRIIMALYCDYLQTYIPTVFENYTSGVEIEEQHIELSLWDTSGKKSELYEVYSYIYTYSLQGKVPCSNTCSVHEWFHDRCAICVSLIFSIIRVK